MTWFGVRGSGFVVLGAWFATTVFAPHVRGLGAGADRAAVCPASAGCRTASRSDAAEAAADVDKGKTIFEQCAACHSVDGSGDYDGPSLKGVIGRKAGSLEDYRYSAAMKRSDVTWDAATLDTYVTDPQAFIPGNRMAFAGIADKAERDDLLAYLTIATQPN